MAAGGRRGPSARKREGDDRHRGVLDLGELGRGHRGDLGEQPGAPARPGRPATTRVGRHDLGVAGRPDREREAGAGRARARGRWRRCAPSKPPARGQRRREPPEAAGDAGEDRGVAAGGRAAASSREPSRARATSCGVVAWAERLRGVTGVHAAEQRLDEPVDDLLPEALGDDVGDAAVPGEVEGRQVRLPAYASSAASLSTPDRARSSRSSGTPISERGSGRSAPRVQSEDDVDEGCTTAQPQRARQVDGLGTAVQHRLGADVDRHSRRPRPAAACRRPRATPRAPGRRGRRRGGGPRSVPRSRPPRPPRPAWVQSLRPRRCPLRQRPRPRPPTPRPRRPPRARSRPRPAGR